MSAAAGSRAKSAVFTWQFRPLPRRIREAVTNPPMPDEGRAMRAVRALFFAFVALALIGSATAANLSCGRQAANICSSLSGPAPCQGKSVGHGCVARCGPVCAVILPVPPAADAAPLDEVATVIAAPPQGLSGSIEQPELPPPRTHPAQGSTQSRNMT